MLHAIAWHSKVIQSHIVCKTKKEQWDSGYSGEKNLVRAVCWSGTTPNYGHP